MTPIADLVELMLSAGVPHNIIVLAVRTAEVNAQLYLQLHSEGDPAAERRREWDRERKRTLRKSNWVELTCEVFKRDDYTCQYCGSREEPLHCDHVVPLSQGGASELGNLTTACARCNVAKGPCTPDEWKRKARRRAKEAERMRRARARMRTDANSAQTCAPTQPAAQNLDGAAGITPTACANSSEAFAEQEKSASLSLTSPPFTERLKREDARARARPKPHRLPDDWQPDLEDLAFARTLLREDLIRAEIDKFRDHYHGLSGARAVSPVWAAKWRGWCRKTLDYNNRTQGGSSGNGAHRNGHRPRNAAVIDVINANIERFARAAREDEQIRADRGELGGSRGDG